MIDTIPALTVLATGSSSFDLLNKAGEPLTGRKIQFNLYPLSQLELTGIETYADSAQHLEERLVPGRVQKFPPDKKVKIPAAFSTAYPEASFERIAKDNYFSWITQ